MHWLLIGYMFLFIDRPFEVWPWLGDLHVERAYMLVTLLAWLVSPKKRFTPAPLHAAFACFVVAVLGSWVLSPWAEAGQNRVEDWLKIVVFYVLLVTTVYDQVGLRRIIIGFIAVMGLYLLHSLREYIGGRHTYRMGIARMIGVDSTLGDPNSFGASIVFSLPIALAVWRAQLLGRAGQLLLTSYFGLSVLCVLLTGSRSSLLGLIVLALWLALRSKKRFLWFGILAVTAPVAFVALPDSLQNRFETIINPEVGPSSAQESGQGRIEGLMKGLELWQTFPIAGAGPGVWRQATRSKIESHNLFGQILGETGTMGALAFASILVAFAVMMLRIRKIEKQLPDQKTDITFTLTRAIGLSVFLLLFLGMFGHNLFRFTWLWYGGFLVVAAQCARMQLADAIDDEYLLETYQLTIPANVEEEIEIQA